MVKIAQQEYKTYGNCIAFIAGDIKLLVTIDLGPRIIFYGKNDRNIMFEDLQDTTSKGGEFFDKNLSGLGIWHLYGGHRLWKSPEYMDTYYPDNAKVEYEILNDNSVIFKSNVERTTGLQKIIKVQMQDNGDVELTQEIKNIEGKIKTPISAWGLTVLDKGTKATIPLSQEDTGFLPNRNVVFWSYTDIKDERINIENDKIVIQQKNIVNPIKIGLYTTKKIEAEVNGMHFTVEMDEKEGVYPDYYCNVECYTNNHIFEIETLSPLTGLAPKESLVHKEYWTLRWGENYE